jgi:hypothetical protein
VNWAAEAGRSGMMGTLDWLLVAGRVALLTVLLVVRATFATPSFATYQRSL